jgi:site-specific DNA recombinase
MNKPSIRCAIYTRKSSEEGLDQSFNSLEAQREACSAFVLSQKHEGWLVLSNRYDDGGFSGGTMERPGLQRLLSDIQSGKVDTVVVYKVDRLTRSLADFAKIIEVFDSRRVSFVSVTQHFNTTTSMGRLTLNVLLSFAQFEREITGERIRDKVAASKKKGIWMGGVVPLGYDCVGRRLVVNQAEAENVRAIFRHYLRLGCVRKLKEFLERNEIRSKVRRSSAGRTYGDAVYSRGALHHLLRNRIYLGEIVHRGQFFPGQHQPIVPLNLWCKVAARLQANNQAHRTGKSNSTPSLLCGKLFDVNGVRFTPTHAVKNGKRYCYYTSQSAVQKTGSRPIVARFPAQELESFVSAQIGLLLQTPEKFTAGIKVGPSKDAAVKRALELAKGWREIDTSKRRDFIKTVLNRVTVGDTTVCTEIDKVKLLATLIGHTSGAPPRLIPHKSESLELNGNLQILRRGSELRIIAADGGSGFVGEPAQSLVKAVARAHDWHERIVAGEFRTIGQLAHKSGLTRRYVRRILQCATLSPRVTEALLTGKHRPNLTLKEILNGVPLDWREQEERILRVLWPTGAGRCGSKQRQSNQVAPCLQSRQWENTKSFVSCR